MLEPIKRRVERELASLRKLLPEVGAGEDTRQLVAHATSAEEKLHASGVLGAYPEIKQLIGALGSALKSEPVLS